MQSYIKDMAYENRNGFRLQPDFEIHFRIRLHKLEVPPIHTEGVVSKSSKHSERIEQRRMRPQIYF